MKQTLSVSIIAKNEEATISKCIKSIKHIADEIIVVDTGSTDNTIKIAETLGAKVFFHQWNYDFSEAKNAALEKCTKDWVLVMDCDEELDNEDSKKIKYLLDDLSLEGVYLRLINSISNISINETPALRLFKNRKEYRFKSRLHEQIFDSIVSLKGKDCFKVTDIKLYHYGYDHNIIDMSKKIERNIGILERFSKEDKDGFFFYSLGNEYAKQGEKEKALQCFEKSFSTKSKEYGYYPYLSVNLIQLLVSFNRPLEAFEKVEFFLKELPQFREMYFLKATCEYELGQFNNSFNSLLNYKILSNEKNIYPAFNFENDNDIEGLLNTLNQLRVEHPKELCSTVIINKNYSNIKKIVQEACDISDKIYVLDSKEKEYEDMSIKKITYNYFSSKETTEEEIIALAMEQCKSQWLIILKSGFVLDLFYKKLLVKRLIKSHEEEISLWKAEDRGIKLKS